MSTLTAAQAAQSGKIIDAAREALAVLNDTDLQPDEIISAACFLVGSLIVGATKAYEADPRTLLGVVQGAIGKAAGIEADA